MRRFVVLIYGIVVYLIFNVTNFYLLGFLANIGVPKSIDSGQTGPLIPSILTNLVLLALFGLQHSVMARPGFKKLFARAIPRAAVRSTYVLASSLCLLTLYFFWAPIPTPIWQVENPTWRTLTWGVFAGGWGVLLAATCMTSHADLFGLRQVWCYWKKTEPEPLTFHKRGFYRFVRHPIMTGFLIVVWATPSMTLGHLVFALGMTVYILIGVSFEERDLLQSIGEPYREYREKVAAFFPGLL